MQTSSVNEHRIHSRGVCNVESNEGLERLHLRVVRGSVLHVRVSIHGSEASGSGAGMSLRSRVHLRPRLRVQARRELHLRFRLSHEFRRRAGEFVRRRAMRPAARGSGRAECHYLRV